MKDFDYEQMKLGKLYLQKGITKENSSLKGKEKAEEINNTSIGDRDEIVRLEREMIGKSGNELYITPPVYVSYGFNIEVGENFYANKDCIFMDTSYIKFGDNVIVGPRCCFYCAGHPIYGNVIVLPGITIGNGSVIGAGSVVTNDVPSNVIVAGNPARVLREINKEDEIKWKSLREEYYKEKKKFEEFGI